MLGSLNWAKTLTRGLESLLPLTNMMAFLCLRVAAHHGPLGLTHLDAEAGHTLLQPFVYQIRVSLSWPCSLLPVAASWVPLMAASCIAPFKARNSPCELQKSWMELRTFHGRALSVVES